MHGADHGPAGQQIDAAPPELAGARSGQHEPPATALFDQRVHGAQQRRHPLHLVDDDHLAVGLGANEVEQTLGPRPVALQRGWMEQVDAYAVRVAALRPRRLAGTAGTEEIVTLSRRLENSIDKRHIESQYGVIVSTLQSPPRRLAPQGPPGRDLTAHPPHDTFAGGCLRPPWKILSAGCRTTDRALSMAKKYVWWQSPERALADGRLLLAQMMTLATADDVPLAALGRLQRRPAVRAGRSPGRGVQPSFVDVLASAAGDAKRFLPFP